MSSVQFLNEIMLKGMQVHFLFYYLVSAIKEMNGNAYGV